MGVAGVRILYVEDNRDLREMVCELLAGPGRVIRAMADGESALAAWQAETFDLVIADISLPGMTGTELARRILAVAPRQWVVFCSGYEYHQELAAMGPNVRSMAKAFDFDAMDSLMAEVSSALSE